MSRRWKFVLVLLAGCVVLSCGKSISGSPTISTGPSVLPQQVPSSINGTGWRGTLNVASSSCGQATASLYSDSVFYIQGPSGSDIFPELSHFNSQAVLLGSGPADYASGILTATLTVSGTTESDTIVFNSDGLHATATINVSPSGCSLSGTIPLTICAPGGTTC